MRYGRGTEERGPEVWRTGGEGGERGMSETACVFSEEYKRAVFFFQKASRM